MQDRFGAHAPAPREQHLYIYEASRPRVLADGGMTVPGVQHAAPALPAVAEQTYVVGAQVPDGVAAGRHSAQDTDGERL